MGYSLGGTAKQNDRRQHADRDAQFGQINDTAVAFMTAGQPVISIDTKNNELVGDYTKRRAGVGSPSAHRSGYGCLTSSIPRCPRQPPTASTASAVTNDGVSVGNDAETARFAVATIGRWWEQMGRACYPDATRRFGVR
jgi:hypothetical protein